MDLGERAGVSGPDLGVGLVGETPHRSKATCISAVPYSEEGVLPAELQPLTCPHKIGDEFIFLERKTKLGHPASGQEACDPRTTVGSV